MNIALDLGESYQRLIELERELDAHRNGLVNHAAVKQVKHCSSSSHYQFVSLVDKYNGFADVYGKELQRFKHLLDQSVHLQQEVVDAAYKAYTASIASSPAPSASAVLMNDDDVNNNETAANNENEITCNYLASTALSAPMSEPAATYAPSWNGDENESARGIAITNTYTSTPVADEQDDFKSVATATRKVPPKPQRESVKPTWCIRPTATRPHINNNGNKKVKTANKLQAKKSTIMTVNNCVSFKYSGKGFEVWKKNGQRAIYQETKLHLTKIFGDDKVGHEKLKRFLVKRAGLSADVIEHVKVMSVPKRGWQDAYSYAVVTVRDSMEHIETAMDKLNAGRLEEIVWIQYPAQYVNVNRNVNRKVFVTGFDILSAKDHRRMTDQFMAFGDLACDIFMNKDKNGNPYAMVTYIEERSATACVQSSVPLRFNGRELNVRYYSEERRNGAKKNNNNNNNKNNKGRFKKSNYF